MSSTVGNIYREAASILESHRDSVHRIACDLAERTRWGESGQVDGRDLVTVSNTLFDMSRDMTAEAGLMHQLAHEVDELEATIEQEVDE
jgi:hypothetical protein